MQRIWDHDLVIFDLDGTLADSHRTVAVTANRTLAHFGMPLVPDDHVVAMVGLPLTTIFDRLAPPGRSPEFCAHYKDIYVAVEAETAQVIPGVLQLLAALRAQGRRMAVATGKSTAGAERALTHHGLRGFFDLALGIDAVAFPKPHPAIVQRALDDLRMPPERAVVIGDTTYDMEMARAAGTAAVGVTWGAHAPDRLRQAGAQHIAADVAALGLRLGV